jgi:hypothetical protein
MCQRQYRGESIAYAAAMTTAAGRKITTVGKNYSFE